MGKAEGIVVDAWFTGFAETLEGNKYFVYISDNQMQATHQALPQRKSPFKFLMTINDNKIPYQNRLRLSQAGRFFIVIFCQIILFFYYVL